MAEINRLAKLRTGEVSLVHSGANRKTYALTKSEGSMSFNVAKFQSVLKTAVEGEAELIADLKKKGADEASIEAAVGVHRFAKSFSDKLTPEQFAVVAKSSGYVAKADDGDDDEDEDEETDKADDENPFDKDDESEDEEPAPKSKKAKKTKKGDDCPPGDMKKTKKSADVDPQMEALFKSNQDLKALVTKLVDEKTEATFVAKAAKEYAHVPGTAEEIGKTLSAAYKVSKANGEMVESLLKKTAAALEGSNLTGTLGTTGGAGDQGSSGAWAKICKAANELVQKSQGSEKPLTQAQAISRVQESDPALYAEYLAEHPAQRAKI